MTWACELTDDAERDLRGLPKSVQRRVARTLTQMAADPFEGSAERRRVAEVFRRRIGDYRILFTADWGNQTVFNLRILLRSEKAYQ